MKDIPRYETMPSIFAHAEHDIRDHLWSLYWLARGLPSKSKIVELGVRGGRSTHAFLAACVDADHILYSFDIEDCMAAVCRTLDQSDLMLPASVWRFQKTDSLDAARRWDRGPVDLIFIDTLHTYPHTLQELEAWCEHLSPEGIICGHDYCNKDPSQDGVEQSVTEFLKDRSEFSLEVRTNCLGLFILRRDILRSAD